MVTLLIALALLGASVAVPVALLLSGWLPRLAARAGYVLDCLLEQPQHPSRLSSRERAEIMSRLWLPW